MEKEYKISEKQFLEIRNALSLLSVYGIHTACITSQGFDNIQDRIKWGFGTESEYLCNVKLIKI